MDYIDQRIDPHKALMPIRTSGSSGQTLKFFIDQDYDQFRKAQFLRPYITNGQKMIDRVVSYTGRPRQRKKFFEYASLLREKQITSHLDPELHLEILRQIKPAIVRGYPSVLALIGTKILEQGPLVRYPRHIFTDSELLTPAMRRSIETAFRRKVVDIYGTLETDNIAYECEQHCGYHMAIDCVIMEFVENGRPVEPGAAGEIVCTVLENYAMPFIRYRLNDFGIYSAKPCSCGRQFPLMTGLQGRTHDYAVTRTGQRISSTTLLAEMDRFADSIDAFQIVQEDFDRFKLVLIPGKEYGRSVTEQIQSSFVSLFPDAVVRIAFSERLQQEGSGKVMPFKSLVGGDKAEMLSGHHES
ncbi:MAG: phenylacetate--CoA ligase family protein [Desulfosarcina sp.]|nr:phenylacetate--CoA ligase family protein [Desulfobacterales bacterium]